MKSSSINLILKKQWPVQNHTLTNFRNLVINDWSQLFNQNPLKTIDDYSLYVTFSSAINRALVIFELSILRKKNNEIFTSLIDLNPKFTKILSPESNIILDNYINSLKKNKFKSLIKYEITEMKKLFKKIDISKKICFRNSQLINKHIKYITDEPQIIPFEYFLLFNLKKSKFDIHNNLKVNSMIESVISRALEFEIEISNEMLTNLKIYISSLQITHKNFISSLEKKFKSTPSELWVFSPQPMQSFIASWVRCSGGRIISHEHGSGEGWSQLALDSLFDFEYSDEFYCYTNANKVNYESIIKKNKILLGNECNIKTINGPNSQTKNLKINKQKIKKVCIIASTYRYDSILFSIQPHGIVSMKLHLDLISLLEKCNIEVFIRPHPENILPNTFTSHQIDKSGPIENITNNYDMVFFDTLQTTAFFKLIREDIPINFLDLKTNLLNQASRELLLQRCSIINVKQDISGNFKLNKNEILSAMDRSLNLYNNDFMNKYMNY